MTNLASNPNYKDLLDEVKQKIQAAQLKAAIAVNKELLILYWEIGKMILTRQNEQGWGAKVIEQLAQDIKKAFPSLQGFSKRNLFYMRQFTSHYPNLKIVQAPLAQISWYHNITLLQKCSNLEERYWYAQKALEHGWSRNVMVLQIERELFQRKGKSITNFSDTLPSPQSDMAQQILKNPYLLDFLNLHSEA